MTGRAGRLWDGLSQQRLEKRRAERLEARESYEAHRRQVELQHGWQPLPRWAEPSPSRELIGLGGAVGRRDIPQRNSVDGQRPTDHGRDDRARNR